ncbi:unnamed protein product [Rangifer tarandus platyrhynchus]|uniref:Uncharacterized protein n=1 Tax=Rangifer tarandus platyrhynchus TaxID=3082113 RepID=A0ABN8Z0M7_RANTA|nr:unnamed protein product [Rangifer tarandus platyrhynchus]
MSLTGAARGAHRGPARPPRRRTHPMSQSMATRGPPRPPPDLLGPQPAAAAAGSKHSLTHSHTRAAGAAGSDASAPPAGNGSPDCHCGPALRALRSPRRNIPYALGCPFTPRFGPEARSRVMLWAVGAACGPRGGSRRRMRESAGRLETAEDLSSQATFPPSLQGLRGPARADRPPLPGRRQQVALPGFSPGSGRAGWERKAGQKH